MHRMVKEFNLTLFEQNYSGQNVLALNPKEYLYMSELGDYYNKHKATIMKLLDSLKQIDSRVNHLMELRKKNKITKQ